MNTIETSYIYIFFVVFSLIRMERANSTVRCDDKVFPTATDQVYVDEYR